MTNKITLLKTIIFISYLLIIGANKLKNDNFLSLQKNSNINNNNSKLDSNVILLQQQLFPRQYDQVGKNRNSAPESNVEENKPIIPPSNTPTENKNNDDSNLKTQEPFNNNSKIIFIF